MSKVILLFSGLINYLKLHWGKSQTILEHCPCWTVEREVDGCVEIKSSLAPREGWLAELWVTTVCRVPQSGEMRLGFILQGDLRYWRTGCSWRLHCFPPEFSHLLLLDLGNMASFSIPSLHSLLLQYESFRVILQGSKKLIILFFVTHWMPLPSLPLPKLRLVQFKSRKRLFSSVFSTGAFPPWVRLQNAWLLYEENGWEEQNREVKCKGRGREKAVINISKTLPFWS